MIVYKKDQLQKHLDYLNAVASSKQIVPMEMQVNLYADVVQITCNDICKATVNIFDGTSEDVENVSLTVICDGEFVS